MTPDELKSAITSWASQSDELQLVEDRADQGTEFALGLRYGALGATTVPVDVVKASGTDRVVVRSTAQLSSSALGGSGAAADAAVQKFVDDRPGWVSGSSEWNGDSSNVTVQAFIYVDGLTRQSFHTTVAEIARSRRLLDRLSGDGASQPVVVDAVPATDSSAFMQSTPAETAAPAADSPSPTPEPTPAATPAADAWGQPAAQPAADQTAAWGQPSTAPAWGQPASQPAPAETPAATPAWGQPAATNPLPAPSFASPAATPAATPAVAATPAAAGAPFAPTHTVPPQGMQAWTAPDPSGPVVANLAGGLPIQVAETRGAWARVICSNGWSGWVDGRIIGVAS